MTRSARTLLGKAVTLNQPKAVEGGVVSWIVSRRGYAVQVFVPIE